jgi:excinuclease UvrABC nuclease subunit
MENWTLTWTKLTKLNEPLIKELKDGIPGVYRLSYKAAEDNYYVFYVGQADDIKQRLLQHISSYETNECIKDHFRTKECFFRYAKIIKDYIRDATERKVYKEYGPKCNYQEPQGRLDINVNLT